MPIITETGTTCPTVAEDRIANALVVSDAWHEISESDTETREAQFVFFDELPLPDDGYAFTLDELMQRRVMALVFTDPESGFRVDQGPAQGYMPKSGRVLVVVERYVRESEAAEPNNQQRWLLNRLGNVIEETMESLTTSFGQRWPQHGILKQPPVSWDIEQQEVRGMRQQATIAYEWGGAAFSSD